MTYVHVGGDEGDDSSSGAGGAGTDGAGAKHTSTLYLALSPPEQGLKLLVKKVSDSKVAEYFQKKSAGVGPELPDWGSDNLPVLPTKDNALWKSGREVLTIKSDDEHYVAGGVYIVGVNFENSSAGDSSSAGENEHHGRRGIRYRLQFSESKSFSELIAGAPPISGQVSGGNTVRYVLPIPPPKNATARARHVSLSLVVDQGDADIYATFKDPEKLSTKRKTYQFLCCNKVKLSPWKDLDDSCEIHAKSMHFSLKKK